LAGKRILMKKGHYQSTLNLEFTLNFEGISIYGKISYLSQAAAWLFQLLFGVLGFVRQINKGDMQVKKNLCR
jgi:hypothetical protein